MDPTNELTITQTNKKNKRMVIKEIKVFY